MNRQLARLVALGAAFVAMTSPCLASGSGEVDGGDIGMVLLDFGACP